MLLDAIHGRIYISRYTRENFNKFCIGGFVDAPDTSTGDLINCGHRELQRHQATSDKGINTAVQSPIGRFCDATSTQHHMCPGHLLQRTAPKVLKNIRIKNQDQE